MKQLKKIIVLGPESTGKSTLCAQLAAHYATLWCPEFAREYLLKNGKDYSFDDLFIIAKGQLALQQEYEEKVTEKWKNETLNSNTKLPILFLDTDMYVMKVWCEYVFNKCHSFILEKAADQTCDLYLLCNPDLPWVKDELREYPDLENRQKLYHHYKDIMVNQNVPWVDISGGYEERLEKAIAAVESI